VTVTAMNLRSVPLAFLVVTIASATWQQSCSAFRTSGKGGGMLTGLIFAALVIVTMVALWRSR
jgi:hypothetical protein